MSRIHRRYPRNWTLDMVRDSPYGGYPSSAFAFALAGPPRYLLAMDVTWDGMQSLLQLIEDRHDAYRGYPVFSHNHEHRSQGYYVRVTGIEVTEAEARRMTQPGTDPLEVLLGTFPECGYRLTAIPDPLVFGG